MPKIVDIGIFLPFLSLLQAIKHHHFFLVEEVLSFDLVGHIWKSVKNWLQEWVFNIYKWKWGRSRWIAYFENYLQKWLGDRYGEFPTRFPTQIPTRFAAEFPARFPTEFPARISCKNFPKIFPQEFPKLDPDWLAPHHPIPNAKFQPITALLNMPTYHKSAKVSPPPFPQILCEPQINE